MKRKRTVLLVMLGAILLSGGGYGYRYKQVLLPHFRTVRAHVLYRAGQPRGLGLQAVRLHGIRTLINLRSPDSEGVAAEKAFAEKHGIAFHMIPAGKTPEELAQSVQRFLAIMDDQANMPVLVHCSRGKERSGVFSAVFRIEYDGWSNQKALYEMQSLGLKPGSMLVAENFIWNYRPRKAAAGAAAPGAPDAVWQE